MEELQRRIYERLAAQYPSLPYGGKRVASAAQMKAAKSNPWLAHLKKVRAQVKKEGLQMSPIEVAKYARESYKKPAGAGKRRAAPKKRAVRKKGGAILGGKISADDVSRALIKAYKKGGSPVGGAILGGKRISAKQLAMLQRM